MIRLNTIHVNYMTRTFGQPFRSENGAGRSGKNAAAAILEAARRAEEQAKTMRQNSDGLRTADIFGRELQPFDRSVIEAMTMDEYKEYVKERILMIPMHSSHMQDTISVVISDEGFEAMKKDAVYEKWVLNDLRTAWTSDNPWARFVGGAYSIIHYGATKEECHAEMWNAGFRNGNGKTMLENMSGDEDKDDKKRKSEIIVKPDGTRYLVISEVIAGMKVTVMSLKLSDPEELLKDGADMETDLQMRLPANGDSLPIS